VSCRDIAYISQQVVEGWSLQRQQKRPGILYVLLFCHTLLPSTDASRPLQIARPKELEDVKENIVVGFCPAHVFFKKLLEGSLFRIVLNSVLHCPSAQRKLKM
jgi:hypothetical protein